MKKALLPLVAVMAATFATHGCHAGALPQEVKTNGFAIGAQAWSFRLFTLAEAIEKNAAAGGKVMELFPGQKISADSSECFDQNLSKASLERVKALLARHHIRAAAIGVISPEHTEANWRETFEVAKALGVVVINTENISDLDLIEKLVKEYDIKVGIHNHPKRAGYRLWDPNYVLSLVKGRDPRIGACADTGHWVRSGLKPVDCLRILKGRIVSSHLKDLNEGTPDAHDVPYGTGVSDIRGILREFRAQGFSGPISVEYEYHWENSAPEIKACIDYVRTVDADS